MNISIRMDVREFEERLNKSAKETVNAIRSSVDRAARTARREFIKSAAADIGVSAAKIRKSTPPVKGTTQSNLSATFTVSKQNISPLETAGGRIAFDTKRGGTLVWATLKMSGGRVPSPLGRSFVFAGRNSGKQLVGHRYGPGKWGTMQGVKTIFAPHPGSEMGVERLVPRHKWQETAERELNANLAAKIQAALDGAQLSASGGPD